MFQIIFYTNLLRSAIELDGVLRMRITISVIYVGRVIALTECLANKRFFILLEVFRQV